MHSNISTPLLSRRRTLYEAQSEGRCVLYVMSRDQRVRDNHALLLAQRHAIDKDLPLAVVFILRNGNSHRSREHYLWMLDGLAEVSEELKRLNIPFMLHIGTPLARIEAMIKYLSPDALYFDFSPFRGQIDLHRQVADLKATSVYEVDTHNVVPVWAASDKQEFSARTIRPKISRQLADYLIAPDQPVSHPTAWTRRVMSLADLSERIDEFLLEVPENGQHDLSKQFPPGSKNGQKMLKRFIQNKLVNYHLDRNDPTADGLSDLSPYLHFGSVSSLRIILDVIRAGNGNSELQPGIETLIEEMVVRKELSDNYCFYNSDYDSLAGAPMWAQATLARHANDPREFSYSLEELESSRTHDPAWNACQKELVWRGKMHGYMRMYWAKKVLEWSPNAAVAIKTLIYLNDFYSLDGGDPNGYVGILWSVGGLHDRPWGERLVYGTVRSMVYSGLKRKFDINRYQETWGF